MYLLILFNAIQTSFSRLQNVFISMYFYLMYTLTFCLNQCDIQIKIWNVIHNRISNYEVRLKRSCLSSFIGSGCRSLSLTRFLLLRESFDDIVCKLFFDDLWCHQPQIQNISIRGSFQQMDLQPLHRHRRSAKIPFFSGFWPGFSVPLVLKKKN